MLNHPVVLPTSQSENDGHCSWLPPSRNATTSSPPKDIDDKNGSLSSEARIAGGRLYVAGPEGGNMEEPCDGEVVIGGRDWEYGGGGGCCEWLPIHAPRGCRRLEDVGW